MLELYLGEQQAGVVTQCTASWREVARFGNIIKKAVLKPVTFTEHTVHGNLHYSRRCCTEVLGGCINLCLPTNSSSM